VPNKIAAGNAGWPVQFRFRGGRHEHRVPELRSGAICAQQKLNMKRIVSIVSGCFITLSALPADTGVQLVSAVTTTNRMGGVYTEETFTRGGKTNLVRQTLIRDGVVVTRVHEFYHHGDLVAVIQGNPNPVRFDPKPGLPYQLGLDFAPSKESLHINGKDFNEAFYATNGVFYPAPDSDLGNWDHTNRVYNPATDPAIGIKDKR
jgi:hypothetical protein